MRVVSVVGPSLLILVGVVLLLNNLEVLLPFALSLRDLWPVLVVVIGPGSLTQMARMPNRPWQRGCYRR